MQEAKRCCKCRLERPLCEFGKLKGSKDGLKYDCNFCRREYREKNKNAIIKKQHEYYNNNKETLLNKNKEYRESNKERIYIQRKEYRKENKDYIKQKQKEYLPIKCEKIKQRRREDINFRISEVLRSKIHKMIKGVDTSYKQYIGCEHETLLSWIEFQFDNKMSWDNFGSYWHIDHILPINSFDFEIEKNKYICFNWTNLQPLQATENQSKSNKLLLHYYFNSIVSIHRFCCLHKSLKGYQAINESLSWLREKLRYGKNPKDEAQAEIGNPQPSS